jgi:hypothetical protein
VAELELKSRVSVERYFKGFAGHVLYSRDREDNRRKERSSRLVKQYIIGFRQLQ